jgi:tripeptide aminopeptidase
MDGESAGNIEDETFSADGATITIEGVSTHPGFAKGKMEHAIKIAAAIVDRLPRDTCSPETTEGKEGFLHPIGISARWRKPPSASSCAISPTRGCSKRKPCSKASSKR